MMIQIQAINFFSSSLLILCILFTCNFIQLFSCHRDVILNPRENVNSTSNVTNLLDALLLGYDNHLRPNFGRAPVEVFIDLHVRSMGPISEIDMSYSMDCYFRQEWEDSRLAYDPQAYHGKPETLALSISMLDKIWKPDTYFYNGKHAYIHTITNPNKFVRIGSDGMVRYSSRLTVKASCPMHLESFPMDTQRCPLEVGSFGYSTRDVIYRWNKKRSVVIAGDMKMSQFDLKSSPSGNITGNFKKGGPYSRLVVSFHFKRLMGSFIIEVYAPSILLVVMSWVSFWINREATADRINLGITTILTMTFLGLETRNDLPKVSYMTALDYFAAITFAFIFASILQFAVVHHFTKVGSGEYYFTPTDPSMVDAAQGRRTSNMSDQKKDGGEGIVNNLQMLQVPSLSVTQTFQPEMKSGRKVTTTGQRASECNTCEAGRGSAVEGGNICKRLGSREAADERVQVDERRKYKKREDERESCNNKLRCRKDAEHNLCMNKHEEGQDSMNNVLVPAASAIHASGEIEVQGHHAVRFLETPGHHDLSSSAAANYNINYVDMTSDEQRQKQEQELMVKILMLGTDDLTDLDDPNFCPVHGKRIEIGAFEDAVQGDEPPQFATTSHECEFQDPEVVLEDQRPELDHVQESISGNTCHHSQTRSASSSSHHRRRKSRVAGDPSSLDRHLMKQGANLYERERKGTLNDSRSRNVQVQHDHSLSHLNAIATISDLYHHSSFPENEIPEVKGDSDTLSPKDGQSGFPFNRFSSLRESLNSGLRTLRSGGKRSVMTTSGAGQTLTFQLNSVSQIDRVSRITFPLAFLIINFIYWTTYLADDS